MNIEIKDKLYKDIESYCTLNELDFNDYVNNLLKKTFMEEKYGDRPFAKAVQYEKPLPANEAPTPTEVEIVVKKNEETNEYEVEAKETTIPIETDIKPQISNNEIISIDRPMEAPDKTNLEEIKNQETVVVVLKEKDEEKPIAEPIDSVKDEPINEPINEQISEPVKEKPKRHKLTKK